MAVIAAAAQQTAVKKTEALLILSPKGDLFETAKNGLVNELRDMFVISTMEVSEATTIDDIHKKFTAASPGGVVLIGNYSIRIYAKHACEHKEEVSGIPVVAILALDVKRAVSGLENVRCIAYETPMVTALVNFRRIIDKPVRSVGVIYRKAFEEFVAKHTGYCKKEKITVKSILINDDASSHRKEISKALKRLVKKERVEAFWVPNDNILLTPELLEKVWLPLFTAYNVPVIVGVESLVKPELNFGTYAVIPDPVAMGEQAAGLIVDLMDEGREFPAAIVYPAISMYSVLNLKKAALIADVNKIKVNEVTRVLTEEKNSH